jgi:hypothetical protein
VLKEKAMRAWSAVLIVSLALLAPSSSYGRGGISRGARSSGSSGGGSVHVRGYTRRDGTQVGSYNRSAPGTASGKTASSKSTRSSSSNTKSLADEAFSPAITPPASLVSHGSISGSTGASSTTNSRSNAAALPSANTTNSSNANQLANQTAAGNLQFLGGYPVLGLALSSGYANPDTAAQRQYGGLVSNARNLIRAGIYPEAAALLQRVINNVPGTRIAGVAQQLLSRMPVQ